MPGVGSLMKVGIHAFFPLLPGCPREDVVPGKRQVLRSQADGGGVWGGDLSGLESHFLSLSSLICRM